MIKFIQIFGERWSGTNYLSALIEKNYQDIEITKLFGGKHWFIKGHNPRCKPNNSTDYQCVHSILESDDTLFVVILRNPYDWLRSMTVNPYHAVGHNKLPFSEFLRKPWIAFERNRVNKIWPENSERYYFIECSKNLLKLRSQKVQHWLNLRDHVKNLEFLKYETLRDDINCLADIAQRHAISLLGDEIENETRYCVGGEKTNRAFSPRPRFVIGDEDLAFIRNELDWALEHEIGYRRGDYEFDK